MTSLKMFTSQVVTHTHTRKRSGYLYAGVMIVSILVGLIGLTSVKVARHYLRAAIDSNSAGQAAELASSAVETGLATVENDPDWRTTYQNNTEYPPTPVAMNGGTWTWKLVDDDGDLDDDDSDFVYVVGIGRHAAATMIQQVTAYPTGEPLPVLDHGLHADGNVSVSADVTLTTNRSVSANGTVNGPGSALVDGDVVGSAGASVPATGTVTTGSPSLQMPGSSVFDYYESQGTAIDVTALPLVGGVREIKQTLLSSQANPFGDPDHAGTYVIDCQNQVVCISDSRIVGTLVLLNAGAGSSMRDALVWDSQLPGFPALMVSGSFTIDISSGILDEALISTNLNPAGTPYLGESDSDSVDTYTAGVRGMIYVTGTLTVPASGLETVVAGPVVVEGTASIAADSTFNHDASVSTNPPPGFASGNPMKLIPGSWLRTPQSP